MQIPLQGMLVSALHGIFQMQRFLQVAMASEKMSSSVKARSGSIVSPVFASLALGRDGFPCSEPQRCNAILFWGDRIKKIDGMLSPTVEFLASRKNTGTLLSERLGPGVDVWVVDAPRFAWRSMACYDGYLHWINQWGTPHCYDPHCFPASTTTINVLKDTVYQLHEQVGDKGCKMGVRKSDSSPSSYRTIIMGFSKGGVVLNQLLAELAYIHQPDYASSPPRSSAPGGTQEFVSIPGTREEFLNSIEQFHYIDVGMNECGAYLTDEKVLEEIAKVAKLRPSGLEIYMHGTPRQWCDPVRGWIAAEKDQCVRLLRQAGEKYSDGKLKVHERMYFEDEKRSLEMHFAILEAFEVSVP